MKKERILNDVFVSQKYLMCGMLQIMIPCHILDAFIWMQQHVVSSHTDTNAQKITLPLKE